MQQIESGFYTITRIDLWNIELQQLKIRHMWKIYGRTALNQGRSILPILLYKCYEPENTMVGLEQDQLLSTVHLRQYNINVRGAVLPTSYMVGVATHPAARRGGVGGALFKGFS